MFCSKNLYIQKGLNHGFLQLREENAALKQDKTALEHLVTSFRLDNTSSVAEIRPGQTGSPQSTFSEDVSNLNNIVVD